MILKINIFNREKTINLKIITERNIAEYNGKVIERDFKMEVDYLLQLLSTWEDSKENIFMFDLEDVTVEVQENNKTYRIHYTCNYPENYEKFKLVIKEIIKCF